MTESKNKGKHTEKDKEKERKYRNEYNARSKEIVLAQRERTYKNFLIRRGFIVTRA